jgi:hypothetical protein
MDKMPFSIDTDSGFVNTGPISTDGGDVIGRDKVHYHGPVYPRLNYRNDIADILDFYTNSIPKLWCVGVGRHRSWADAVASIRGDPGSR